MKIPYLNKWFVSRKEYQELEEKYDRDRGIISYVPQDNQNPSVGTDLAHHDKRIGWVRPIKFNSYDEYLSYMKQEREKDQLLNER